MSGSKNLDDSREEDFLVFEDSNSLWNCRYGKFEPILELIISEDCAERKFYAILREEDFWITPSRNGNDTGAESIAN